MISDESITNKQTEYYERGVLKKEVRSYEVSLWTLQDTFITVLKWSDVEQRGRIENPKMTLSTDGTQNFEFSIPMYIWQHGEKIENPNWHNTQDGNLIAATRKIKVIFNKGESDEAVYEFIILDVTESHEGEIATCQVKCEGLAFHELGKIGYNYSLSQENFITAYEKWQDNGATGRAPIQNIDYWCQEINLEPYPVGTTEIDPRIWYYQVQMVYGTMEIDAGSGQAVAFSNIIYEEPFVSEWDENLNPTKIERQREKARPIEASQSNIYNITQQIAQTFGVFCRYEYRYDVNYHIIARTIVFYNSFSAESNGIQSFTYPYTSSAISRTKDATNLTTKLYVLNLDDETAYDGYRSIMNVAANKTRENYIMNFDYMKEIGNIDKEQHDQIVVYEKLIRRLNLQLIKLQGNLAAYQQQVPEIEAKITVYKNSIEIGEKERASAEELKNALTGGTGYLEFDATRPDTRFIFKQSQGYSLQFSTDSIGIYPQTIKVYESYDATNHVLSQEFPGVIKPIENEFKNVIGLNLYVDVLPRNTHEMPNKVYLTYKYDPHLYYDNIINMWNLRILTDNTHLEEQKVLLYGNLITEQGRTGKLDPDGVERDDTGLLGLIDSITTNIDELLAEKKELILKFERMMGPALREGYWQPDSYIDYGNQKYGEHSFILESGKAANFKDQIKNVLYADSQDSFIAGWDPNLEDTEQDTYYYSGFSNEGTPNKTYYHYVDLSDQTFSENIMNYSFIFQNPLSGATIPRNYSIESTKIFGIGADALVCYLARKVNNTYSIIPALILIGEKGLADYEMSNMINGDCMRAIGKISYSIKDNKAALTVTDGHSVTVETITSDDDFIVYPRLKFSSLMLKTDTSSFFLSYNKTLSNSTTQRVLFDRFSDYYLITKTISRTENNEKNYYVEHFFTIKPEALFSAGLTGATNKTSLTVRADYTISNADVAIYLDALDISKENAYPKVSYEITPNVIDASLMRIMYKQLARIIMINDPELKLEDAFGYISSIDLDLDNPWQDTITVQNYTNKFEDLFASIVASSESMQKVSGMMGNMLTGGIPLSPEAFQETLNMNQDIMNAYLEANFDGLEVVQEKLAELFKDASMVLGASEDALNDLANINSENFSILSSFIQNVSDEITSKTFRSVNRPTGFKEGDLWIKINSSGTEVARYVATSNYADVKNSTSPTAGFTRMADGTLAQIRGAALNIDTVAGNIDLEAEHDIGITAASNVDIVGGQEINLSGPTVNIAASSSGPVGGINLITSVYDKNTKIGKNTYTNVSKVLIHPDEIYMASAALTMKGSTIDLITSGNTAESTSAITLSADEGINIVSGKSITLFSGTSFSAGANVRLNNDLLLFGVSSNDQGNVVKITKSYVVISSGRIANKETSGSPGGITGVGNTLTGALFTNNSIGLAISTGNEKWSAILMDSNGVTIGSGVNVTNATSTLRGLQNGSYVRIAPTGIDIGSSADLYVNTNNCKLQTNYSANGMGTTLFALGSNLSSVVSTTTPAQAQTLGTVKFLVNNKGAYINGTVYASGGKIGGFTIASDRLYRSYQIDNDTKYVGLIAYEESTQYSPAFYAGASNTSASDATFLVRQNGSLTATNATITGTIYAKTGKIGRNIDETDPLITLHGDAYRAYLYSGPNNVNVTDVNGWYLGTNGLRLNSSGGSLVFTDNTLSVTGTITATAGAIGGWEISSSGLRKVNENRMLRINNLSTPIYIQQPDSANTDFFLVKQYVANASESEYPTLCYLRINGLSNGESNFPKATPGADIFLRMRNAGTIISAISIRTNLDTQNLDMNIPGFPSVSWCAHIPNLITTNLAASTLSVTSTLNVSGSLVVSSITGGLTINNGNFTVSGNYTSTFQNATITNLSASYINNTQFTGIINGAKYGTTTTPTTSNPSPITTITGLSGRYLLITGGSGSGKGGIWWIQSGTNGVYQICGGSTVVAVTVSGSDSYSVSIKATAQCFYQLYKIS